jgi:hypothetical protein
MHYIHIGLKDTSSDASCRRCSTRHNSKPGGQTKHAKERRAESKNSHSRYHLSRGRTVPLEVTRPTSTHPQIWKEMEQQSFIGNIYEIKKPRGDILCISKDLIIDLAPLASSFTIILPLYYSSPRKVAVSQPVAL